MKVPTFYVQRKFLIKIHPYGAKSASMLFLHEGFLFSGEIRNVAHGLVP